jgi:hypothetical protein
VGCCDLCGLYLKFWFQCVDNHIGIEDQIESELRKIGSISVNNTMAGVRECISGVKYSEM